MRKIIDWIKRHKFLTVVILLTVLSVGIWQTISGNKKSDSGQFATLEIKRGNLKQIVSATGEIMPVNTIKVGSQVSGNIEKIFVDYNDKVKKGDVLLTIDPSVLQASADESKAALDSASAQ